jgi:hypothetical protein
VGARVEIAIGMNDGFESAEISEDSHRMMRMAQGVRQDGRGGVELQASPLKSQQAIPEAPITWEK